MFDIELTQFNGSDTVDRRNHHDENAAMVQISADQDDRLTNNNIHEPTEGIQLLSTSQGSNGAHHTVDLSEMNQNSTRGHHHDSETSAVCRLRKQLNHKVLWKIRLWMVIIILFVLIALLIVASIVLCSVIHEDLDESYDPVLFVVPLDFNGSFQLTNQIFTPDLLYPASNQSKTLSSQLKQTLSVLYSSSPALGRYFSSAEISDFRNSSGVTGYGSVVAEYLLHFQVPLDDAELKQFTMSQEMVFNIFKQSLYDHEPERNHPLYIQPASLNMHVASVSGDSVPVSSKS